MPPRFISDSIFCIQFLPVTRFSFFTRGNRPQKVKKMVVSWPIAADVVARIRVGQILSSSPLQAKMTSFFAVSGTGSCIASSMPTVGFSVGVIALMACSPLLQEEAVDAAVLALFHDGVSGRLAPGSEVRHRSGIGRQYLDQLAGCHLLHLFRRLHDWNRAV